MCNFIYCSHFICCLHSLSSCLRTFSYSLWAAGIELSVILEHTLLSEGLATSSSFLCRSWTEDDGDFSKISLLLTRILFWSFWYSIFLFRAEMYIEFGFVADLRGDSECYSLSSGFIFMRTSIHCLIRSTSWYPSTFESSYFSSLKSSSLYASISSSFLIFTDK